MGLKWKICTTTNEYVNRIYYLTAGIWRSICCNDVDIFSVLTISVAIFCFSLIGNNDSDTFSIEKWILFGWVILVL